MEDLVNMSLSDVILKEKAKRKQVSKKEGHVKAKNKQHNKPKKAPAKQNPPQQKGKGKPGAQVAPKGPKGPKAPKAAQAPKEGGKRKLFIKNLHSKADNSTLFKHFKQYGTMTRCGVNWDVMGKSKGTAIVQYEEAADAVKALKSNGVELKGQVIEVGWA
jgi:RNA recognition motif-containing protein